MVKRQLYFVRSYATDNFIRLSNKNDQFPLLESCANVSNQQFKLVYNYGRQLKKLANYIDETEHNHSFI